MNATIYVDTATGAFGGAAELVIVDATDEEVEDLQDQPDSTVMNFGVENGDRVLDLVPERGAMRVQILHGRDPDSDCGITVFVNGKRIPDQDVSIEDIDPGRGYEPEDWEERLEESRADTTEFGQLVTATLEQFSGTAAKYSI
jgi:hypothetical protein